MSAKNECAWAEIKGARVCMGGAARQASCQAAPPRTAAAGGKHHMLVSKGTPCRGAKPTAAHCRCRRERSTGLACTCAHSPVQPVAGVKVQRPTSWLLLPVGLTLLSVLHDRLPAAALLRVYEAMYSQPGWSLSVTPAAWMG